MSDELVVAGGEDGVADAGLGDRAVLECGDGRAAEALAVRAVRLLSLLVLADLWPDLCGWAAGEPGGREALAESSSVILGVARCGRSRGAWR